MKKLTLIIFALLVSTTILKAQRTVVVCGQIDNPVANQTVWVSFFSSPSGCTVQDTTVTDSLGRYSHTITIGAGCAYNGVRMNMLGCKGVYDTLWNTQYYDTLRSGPDTLKANFKYCDTCNVQASFIDSINGQTATFSSTSSSSFTHLYWTFGDGGYSTSQSPSHTYNSPGRYIVCLIGKDTINGCSDTICKSITVVSNNPCFGFNANFSTQFVGLNVNFYSSSNSQANVLIWDFGDSTTLTDTAKSAQHTYSSPGTYTVCHIAHDTINGCSDTVYKQITISASNCTGFNANFSDSIGGQTVSFNGSLYSSGAANQFFWTFGDGGSSTAPNPTHIYNSPGVYTVCLVIKDTVRGCIDTTCKSIAVASTNCNGFTANFSYSINCSTATFTNSSSSSATTFSWVFSNRFNTSTLPNPTFNFSSAGNFSVCLTAVDSINGCSDTICKQLNIPYSLQGTIYRNNNQLADSGRVWLIRMTTDSITGDTILTAIDSAVFVQPNATYNFPNVTPGSYLLKAALLPGAAFYGNRLPTYYIKETRWDKATFINVNSPCATADIVLKAGNNPGGPGFIGGLVKQGANKTGDPLEKILVVLYHANGDPSGFTYTDINGEYAFDNIALGDYKVVVDLLGKHSAEYIVTIDATNPSDKKGNFDVNTKDVTLSKKPTGIAKLIKGKLSLYPNPAANSVNLYFDATTTETTTITVMDMSGKVVLTQNIIITDGSNHAQLYVTNIESGLYLVTIKTNNAHYTGKLSIVK